MAYGLIYKHTFYSPYTTGVDFIEIYKKDYTGDIYLIDNSDGVPLIISHAGNRDDIEDVVILGKKLIFSFYIPKSDYFLFEDMFEGEYKDYKITLNHTGKANPNIFQGYIQLENLSKIFITNSPYIKIELSAIDGLIDLKNIPFGNGKIIRTRMTVLECIKEALSPIGIDLDFDVHLNTFEQKMIDFDTCPLLKTYINTQRFLDIQEGVTVNTNCYDVIEQLLKPFGCKLSQYHFYYFIDNIFEKDNSFSYRIHWDTLIQYDKREYNPIIDISSYKFLVNNEEQKIQPFTKTAITFRNKDLGELLFANLWDWESSTSPWTIYSYDYSVSGTTLTLKSKWNSTIPRSYVITDAFYIDYTEGEDIEQYIKIEYERYFDEINSIYISDNIIGFYIQTSLIDSEGVEHRYQGHYLSFNNWEVYESPFVDAFKITKAGWYKIKIALLVTMIDYPSDTELLIVKLKNVSITNIILSEGAQITTTTDIIYEKYSNKGIQIYESEIFFGDSKNVSDIGAFLHKKDDGTFENMNAWYAPSVLTTSPSKRYSIFDIYCTILLNNRYNFKNFVRLSVVDRWYLIEFNSILKISDKYYYIASYKRETKEGIVKLDLIELITENQTYDDIRAFPLDSINSHSSGNSSSIPSGSVRSHSALLDLDVDDHTQYFNETRADNWFLNKIIDGGEW